MGDSGAPNQETPLLGPSSSSSKHTIIIVVLSITLFCCIAGLFVLGFLYRDEVNKNESPPPPPLQVSVAYDFPVWPQQEWNISDSHTRTYNRELGPTGNTWSSLDISQDGSLMVFESLGDLFLLILDPETSLPVGEAPTLLVGGVQWAREPSFSPDATRVAYTSDLSGLDNIWVVDIKDTTSPLQLTHETFRWVSAPTFSPDGNTVAALKWLTSTRALGAGELWSFSSTEPTPENEGTLLIGIDTPTSQLGPEEPTYHPTSSSIYFSRNSRSTATFQYSQNVHAGLYSIYSYKFESKEVTRIVGGSGGAARPVLSRDGQLLAFVRRIEFDTCLVVRNLTSSMEVVVYHGLDLDQMGSYSPCGNYPRFAFAPDNKHVIIWGQGQFFRVDVTTGEVEPFVFDPQPVTMELTEQHVFSTSVTEETFQTSVTKWASWTWNSDNTSSIVFTNVAKSYVASFNWTTGEKLGTEVDLTIDEDHFAFGPSFPQNDPSFIIHSIWNDAVLGALQLVELDENKQPVTSELLTSYPSRFHSVAVSPDGKFVCYIISGTSNMLGTQFPPEETGLFVMPVKVGENGKRMVKRLGSGTGKWVDESHLGVQVGNYPNTRLELYKIKEDVNGTISVGSPKLIAFSKYGSDIIISPNQDFIAFVEFGWVHVVKASSKIPKNGLEVSTRPGFIPKSGVLRVSADGGINLQWVKLPEGSDSALTWVLGSQMYFLKESDMKLCFENASTNDNTVPPSADCAVPKTIVFDISTVQQAGVPSTDRLLCLANASIVPMTSRDSPNVINGEIHIRGDTITDVINYESSSPDELCSSIVGETDLLIDLEGGVVYPGFIDVHAHWDSAGNIHPQASWELMINLAFGVTTMHNPSTSTVNVFQESELVKAGRIMGPRILSTGTIIYGAAGREHQEIDSLDTALSVLRRHQAWGAQSVKSYNQPQRSARQMILEAARQLEMNVVPEGGMMPAWDLSMLVDSHTTIEHNIPVIMHEDAQGLWSFSKTSSTPTLIVCYGDLWGEIYNYQNENVWQDEREIMYASHLGLEAKSMRRLGADDQDYYHFQVSKNLKQLADAGVNVEIGAHGQQQGIGFTWETTNFALGGQSPYEVLYAATKGGAISHDMQKIGEIAVGNLADLVIYPPDEDPMDDISFIRSLDYVVRGGRMYESPSLNEIFPDEKVAPVPPIKNDPDLSETPLPM